MTLPLFPLATVLFPGGLLPLRVFEQRYIELAKRSIRDDSPFGVCLIGEGAEVMGPGRPPPKFEAIGTLARITDFDMPESGILHLRTRGETRFRVLAHRVEPNGLVVADAVPIDAEPALPLPADASAARAAGRADREPGRRGELPGPAPPRRRVVGRLPPRRGAAAAARRSGSACWRSTTPACGCRCCAASCSSRDSFPDRRGSSRYNSTVRHTHDRNHHGWPQQVGEHQAQEGRDRRQARQDLHPPDQGNHRRRAPGRRRPVDESAPAARRRQGVRQQHAQGHDRARGQARRRRARGRQLRGRSATRATASTARR